jgi:hypothetical protein
MMLVVYTSLNAKSGTLVGQHKIHILYLEIFSGEKKLTVQLNITNEKFKASLADFESLDFLNVAERVENAVSSISMNAVNQS